LDRNFGYPRDAVEDARDLIRHMIEAIEIIAEDIDGNGRCVSRDRLLNALAEKSLDREVDADKARERVADFRPDCSAVSNVTRSTCPASNWLAIRLSCRLSSASSALPVARLCEAAR
jgi:hypothetical protein